MADGIGRGGEFENQVGAARLVHNYRRADSVSAHMQQPSNAREANLYLSILVADADHLFIDLLTERLASPQVIVSSEALS